MAHARRLILTAQIFGSLLHVAIFLSLWGDPHAQWMQAGLWLLGAGGNMVIPVFLLPRLGYDRGETIRTVYNVVVHVPIGILCGWSFVSWLFVPFLTALATTPPARHVPERIALQLLGFDLGAALTGGDWRDMLIFSSISLFLYFVTTAYLELVSNLLRERDRTLLELHDAQQLAIAQEKIASIGQIAAGVAHEINNPMCFVTANVQALLDDLQNATDLPPALVEYRDEVLPETVDGIKRVNSIVDDLRRFARGEPERFVSFDLSVEITAAVRMARTQVKPSQSLELEVPPELTMTGMPRQLGQVILNLIVNALQALRDQGRVRVRAAAREELVEITVSDDGAGMTEDTRSRIFEPFYSTKERQGIGLGLAMVNNIVKAHGGSIEVESAPGSGSSFRMTLPRGGKQPGPRALQTLQSLTQSSISPSA